MDFIRSNFYKIAWTKILNLSLVFNHQHIQSRFCHSCRMTGTELDAVHQWPPMHSKTRYPKVHFPTDPNSVPFSTYIVNSLCLASFILLYRLSSSTVFCMHFKPSHHFIYSCSISTAYDQQQLMPYEHTALGHFEFSGIW